MAAPEQLLDLISPARRDVLLSLRRRGEAWSAALADDLHLSVSALRQTLTTLEAAGLVSSRQVRSGPGRPRMYYRLTPAAEDLFYPRHGVVFQMLGTALELAEEGAELTLEAWAKRAAAAVPVAAATGAPGNEGPEDGLAGIEHALRAAGFSPESKASDAGPLLTLHSCPVLEFALQNKALCELERHYAQALAPGTAVLRREHRLDGDAICVYQVLPAEAGPLASD